MDEVEAQCDRIAEKMEKIVSLYCDIQAMIMGNDMNPPMVEVPSDRLAAEALAEMRKGGL